MHGRLKVRTTKEENARKQVERALKVKAYRAAMEKINMKRKENEFDTELMQITTPLLQRNPDIATLWNIRRQCLLQKFEELKEDVAEKQKLCDDELRFTETCLLANPKSYCSWHQRCWVLQQSPEPNWQRELDVCSNYLKLDERNFHTWDYRRFVIAKGGFTPESEFKYTTEKIKVNFSNYSSWHHRSLLLPILFPNKSETNLKCTFQEDILKQELDMVLTAAFTDPNDSSAWFYQRWLLGPQNVDSYVCAFRSDSKKGILAFSKPLASNISPKLLLESEGKPTEVDLVAWQDHNATVWLADLPESYKFPFQNEQNYLIVQLEHKENIKLALKPLEDGFFYYFKPPQDNLMVSLSLLDELDNQLKSCEDLLQYEPDSKWTLLTTVCLMRAIDRRQYFDKMQKHLQSLMTVDFLRQGYYKDLATEWNLEEKLSSWIASKDFPHRIDLSQETELSFMPFKQYFTLADEVLLPAHLDNTENLPTFNLCNSI